MKKRSLVWNRKPAKKVRHLGHNFDSLLEARWATVFNELDLYFNYEPYRSCYLHSVPDFFIPKWDIWFEAKNPMVWQDKDEVERVVDKAVCLMFETESPTWISFGGFGSRPWSAYEFFTVIPPEGSALTKYKNFLLLQGVFIPGPYVDMFWGFEIDTFIQKYDVVNLTDNELLIPLSNQSGFDFFWLKNRLNGSLQLYFGGGDSSYSTEINPNISRIGLEKYWEAYEKAKLTKFFGKTDNP